MLDKEKYHANYYYDLAAKVIY